MSEIQKNCLSYWFPKLQYAGVPVPETVIVRIGDEEYSDLRYHLLDGVEATPGAKSAIAKITEAVESIGLPAFLRSGQTSGKHNWNKTCHVSSIDNIRENIYGIAEYSEMAGMLGLPYNVWCARELLPVEPFGVCPRYGDMPVVQEFRVFVKDGAIQCAHPYWPENALAQGRCEMTLDVYAELCDIEGHIESFAPIVSKAGAAVGGAWSVDVLKTKRGWYVTDMAIAGDSFHWPGCANDKMLRYYARASEKGE